MLGADCERGKMGRMNTFPIENRPGIDICYAVLALSWEITLISAAQLALKHRQYLYNLGLWRINVHLGQLSDVRGF